MTQFDRSRGSEYLTALDALVAAESSRLSPQVAGQLARIMSDTDLDGRAAEDLVSDLAYQDDELAAMWDEVQETDPTGSRAPDTVNSQKRRNGPTHRWICPEPACRTDEPGRAWACSTITQCPEHGTKLVRRDVAGTGP